MCFQLDDFFFASCVTGVILVSVADTEVDSCDCFTSLVGNNILDSQMWFELSVHSLFTSWASNYEYSVIDYMLIITNFLLYPLAPKE